MDSVSPLPSGLGKLIVTTGTTASDKARRRCHEIAVSLSSECLPRRNGGGGLNGMLDDAKADRALVVEEYGLAIAHRDGTVFRWHPNMGFVRAFNLVRGQSDTFAEAAQLKPGDKLLDCTLGFASEALIASLLVGESGEVVGLESAPELALVTAAGLQERELTQPDLMRAARRIEVVNADYRDYIAALAIRRFDVIAFDPFFGERTEGSEANVNPLLRFGNASPLDTKSVLRAIQVAIRRVIVKHSISEEIAPELLPLRSKIVKTKRGVVRYSIFDAR